MPTKPLISVTVVETSREDLYAALLTLERGETAAPMREFSRLST